jgi:hypothetical protein
LSGRFGNVDSDPVSGYANNRESARGSARHSKSGESGDDLCGSENEAQARVRIRGPYFMECLWLSESDLRSEGVLTSRAHSRSRVKLDHASGYPRYEISTFGFLQVSRSPGLEKLSVERGEQLPFRAQLPRFPRSISRFNLPFTCRSFWMSRLSFD